MCVLQKHIHIGVYHLWIDTPFLIYCWDPKNPISYACKMLLMKAWRIYIQYIQGGAP